MSANEVLLELSLIARAARRPDGDPVLSFKELTRGQTAALVEVTVEFMEAAQARHEAT